MEDKTYKTMDHDKHAKSCDPNDFWGQIKRSVNGQPVSEEQVQMIVKAVTDALSFEKSDVLLDLACGNAALASYFYESCSEYLGVDFSESLIEVAKKNFEKPNTHSFLMSGAAEYIVSEKKPERFTKVLCYGSFPYFSSEDALTVLKCLYTNYKNVKKVFIGNLPDKDLVDEFYYKDRGYTEEEINDHLSSIGIWRTKDEFAELVQKAGWKNFKFSGMPKDSYAHKFRYDILLWR
ncbi:MAG: class I SAM-dependent methyltransferase [Leptospirales bacterium]